MHEYEFRLVVQSSEPFSDDWLFFNTPCGSSCVRSERVLYVKPHFRFRNGQWEIKRKVSSEAVFHEGLWFHWVHSVEKPFVKWSRSELCTFLHKTGNFQNPFHVEMRRVVDLDQRAKLYTFAFSPREYRLIFEWEYGYFATKLTDESLDGDKLLKSLCLYRRVYDAMRGLDSPPYTLKENVVRKPVTNISQPTDNNERFLFAKKADGIFGIVYSYKDRIKEKWEDYEVSVIKRDEDSNSDSTIMLGDGIVYSAEKLDNGNKVLLLDVYQVQGIETSRWSRRAILTEFLYQIQLPEHYSIQKYTDDLQYCIHGTAPFKTDGWIAHDVLTDKIYKWKTFHSIDLMYSNGFFWAPDFKIAAKESDKLEDGCVYEIATTDGSVLRKRRDRFKSNTKKQIQNELKFGWSGSPMIPIQSQVGETHKKKKTVMG